MPLILIGSFALMVLNLPIAPFQNAMSRLFGGEWKMWLLHVHRSTFSVMSLAALIAVSYASRRNMRKSKAARSTRAFIILNAFCSYVAFMRLQDEAIPFARTNSTSLFWRWSSPFCPPGCSCLFTGTALSA